MVINLYGLRGELFEKFWIPIWESLPSEKLMPHGCAKLKEPWKMFCQNRVMNLFQSVAVMSRRTSRRKINGQVLGKTE